MFCYNCGKQISNGVSFCQYCGAAQKSTNSNIANNQSIMKSNNSSGDLDRDALKVYLGNVLSLECIREKYERTIYDLSCNINKGKKNNYYKKYMYRKWGGFTYTIHFWYNGDGVCIGYYSDGSGIFHDQGEGEDFSWRIIRDESVLDRYKKPNAWTLATSSRASFFEKRKQAQENCERFWKFYEDFKAEAPTVYRDNLKKIANWQQKLEGMSTELRTVKKLLDQAYSVNIIPAVFRNKRYAIYYLYDFISTSRESFTTALLHYDLDEIKTKLDKIIAQQEEIIIQNAIMTSQNESLMAQNQQKLKHLANIERNSSQAAQYAQIAANNAEVCAWISVANYIRSK